MLHSQASAGNATPHRVHPRSAKRLEIAGVVLTLTAAVALYNVPQVPTVLLAFVGLAILPGLYMARAPSPPGYRRAWNWAVIVFIGASLAAQLVLGLPAHTVLVMICLFLLLHRWYTERGRKEYVEIWCLTALMMLVAALQEPGAALLGLLGVWGAATMPFMSALAVHTMAAGHGPGQRNWAGAERLSPVRPWLIAPMLTGLALLVFLVVPRTRVLEPQGHELLLPSQPARSMLETGFSGQVHLQGMTMLRETEGVAVQITVPPAFQGAGRLRLRAHALDKFDGEVWRRGPGGEVEGPVPLVPPRYAIPSDLEEPAGHRHDLIALRPVNFPGPMLPIPESTVAFESPPRGADLYLHADGAVEAGRLRTASEYRVLAGRTPIRRPEGPVLRGAATREHLRVPAELRPAAQHLAKRIFPEAAFHEDPVSIAEEVEKYFRRHGRYSLDLTHLDNTSAVLEQFMTGSLRGHCELFASAMAVVLRERGIPARLAVGFSGSDPQPGTGQDTIHLVRHRHAHAWVEVHDGKGGWVPFDPTPPPLYAAMPGWTATAEVASLLGHPLRQAVHLMESYDLEAQMGLLRTTRDRGQKTLEEWEHGALLRAAKRFRQNVVEPPLLGLAALLLGINLLALYVHRCWKRGRGSWRQKDAVPAGGAAGGATVPRLFMRLLRELGAEAPPPPGTSPGEAIRRAAGRSGVDGATAGELARLYTEWRFGRRAAALERAMREILSRVRESRRGMA